MSRILSALSIVAALLLAIPVLAFDVTVEQLQGKPDFKNGEALGYFVWIDGDTWKVRWTTFGGAHQFMGRVMTDAGSFRDFKRVDPDTERKVIAPGRPARVVRGPRGRVVGVTGGKPTVVATKEEDVILQETEQLLRWNTKTTDDTDGLDFKISRDVSVVRFQMAIDGKPVPREIEVGKNNVKPNQLPLVVRVR